MSSSSSSESSSDSIHEEQREEKNEDIKGEDRNEEEEAEEEEAEEDPIPFIFIYEDDGKYHCKLSDIKPENGKSVIIHPVYYEGYDNNMNSEEIRYSMSDKKYKRVISDIENDGSWLDIIYDYPESVDPMDLNEAIIYKGHFYHCDGDLLYHLAGEEPERIDLVL